MLLAIESPDGDFYYITDRSIIDSDGNADWYSYQPFGEIVDEVVSPNYTPYRRRFALEAISSTPALRGPSQSIRTVWTGMH